MILSGGHQCASGEISIFVVETNRGSAGRGGISHMVRLISLNTTLLISYSSHNVDMQRAGRAENRAVLANQVKSRSTYGLLNGCGTWEESSSNMSQPASRLDIEW